MAETLNFQNHPVSVDDLNRRLASAPTYQKALRGLWTDPSIPNTPNFKVEQLRAAAKADGIDIPGGHIDTTTGQVDNPNYQPWYQNPAVLGPLAVGGATLGAGLFAGGPAAAAGAAGAGEAGVLPSAQIGSGFLGPIAGGTGLAGVDTALGAGAAGAAGAGAAGGAGAIGAAGAGGGLLDTILKFAPVGAGLVGKLATGGFGGGGNNAAGQMSPELQQMLQQSLQRMNQQQPLFDAVTRQALAGLPTYAKQGN